MVLEVLAAYPQAPTHASSVLLVVTRRRTVADGLFLEIAEGQHPCLWSRKWSLRTEVLNWRAC
jgi:hypothetical protein